MATDKKGRKLPKGIRQRYDGYEGRFMHEGQEYLVHGATITETQKLMEDLRYKVRHGIIASSHKVIFSEWFNEWFEDYEKIKAKESTCNVYKNLYHLHLKKPLGKKKLCDIRAEHIQKLFNNMAENGCSISTIQLTKAVLDGCIKQATRNRLIDNNPLKAVTLPTTKAKPKKVREAMTKEEQALFMEYAKDSQYYNLFAVLLRTGMRSGEIRGLQYKDIDKKNGVIHIRRTAYYTAEQGIYTNTPKTKTSMRDIPLTDDILSFLNAEKKRQLEYNKAVSIEQYVFCDINGQIVKQEYMQREIKRIVGKIVNDGHELKTHVTMHVFRHTFATRAIEAGMPPQVLKTILGHSSLAMTMDLYSHVLPDTKASEMQKIASAF